MERQPISREGYDKLLAEIKHLEEDEMPKIAVKIAEARAALAREWRQQVEFFRQGPLAFSTDARREAFFARADKAADLFVK